MKIIHLVITILQIIAAIAIFTAPSPIHSALFLILSFCLGASIFFLFEVEFLGVLFVLVYVGAVAVLFLFIIMMLKYEKKVIVNQTQEFYINIFTKGSLLFILLYFLIREAFSPISKSYVIHEALLRFDYFTSIQIIAQVLYDYFNLPMLIVGFILLIALVGAIHLTLEFKQRQMQDNLRQLARNPALRNNFK